MTYRILDVETTGLPSDNKDGEPTGMMEIAWTDLSIDGIIKPPVSMLVDSGIPVSIGARACHQVPFFMKQISGVKPREDQIPLRLMLRQFPEPR